MMASGLKHGSISGKSDGKESLPDENDGKEDFHFCHQVYENLQDLKEKNVFGKNNFESSQLGDSFTNSKSSNSSKNSIQNVEFDAEAYIESWTCKFRDGNHSQKRGKFKEYYSLLIQVLPELRKE